MMKSKVEYRRASKVKSEEDKGGDQNGKKVLKGYTAFKKGFHKKSLRREQQKESFVKAKLHGKVYSFIELISKVFVVDYFFGRIPLNTEIPDYARQNVSIDPKLQYYVKRQRGEKLDAPMSHRYREYGDYYALLQQRLYKYDSSSNVDLDKVVLDEAALKHEFDTLGLVYLNQDFNNTSEFARLVRKVVGDMSFFPLTFVLKNAGNVIGDITSKEIDEYGKKGYLFKKGHQDAEDPSPTHDSSHGDCGKRSSSGSRCPSAPEDPVSNSPPTSPASVPYYDTSGAKHPEYVELRRRRDSFLHWPATHAHSPQELAAAGFFYSGHADCVRCHFCDLALKHWDLNHRPLEEHARHSPSCGYVKLACRIDFILKAQEQLHTIIESARESSTGKVVDRPPSDKCTRRARPSRRNRSHRPVKCPNKTVSVWFPHCGHFVPCRECAPPHSRCPACPPGAIPTANLSDPHRHASEEPADEKQADRTDTARPAAWESVAGESGTSSSHQPQSDSDPSLVDLRVTRPERIAMEISALLHSGKETKTGDAESEGNEDENGHGILSFDAELKKALHFPPIMDISIRGTKKGSDEAALLHKIKMICKKPPVDRHQDMYVDLHQTKPQLMQGDDERSESNPHVTELAPRFPMDKPEDSQGLYENDDANEALEDQSQRTTSFSQQTVQDAFHVVHEAKRSIKMDCEKPPPDRYQDTYKDLHQTKPQLMQGDDERPELNPHEIEHAPRFPMDKPENSQGLHENDDANEALEDHFSGTTSLSQQSVQDILHAVYEATRGIKHPVIHQMLAGWRPLFQEITAQPVVPQSTEEGLARVDFRSPNRDHMNVEGHRVGTFLLYPRAEEHSVLRLANAGLYFTGRGDTLACFCCDVTFSYADRRPGEDPYDIHRQLNPNCPHLTGGETRNVFIQDEQTRATSSRDITSEGSEPEEPNTSLSQLIAEAIARIRRAVRPLYSPAVPNAASQNQNYLLSMEAEHAAPNNNNNNNNNATHGRNRSFEEPRPGQNSHNPLIQTISNVYENGSPAPREGRTMGGGNNERSRQGEHSFLQSGNSSGQWFTAPVYHQTFQAGINGGILNPPSINTQESSRPLNEPTRPPVPPQSSAQVNDAFQHSPSNPQPPVSAPSPSPAARQGEASPPSASPAVSDYDPSRAVHAHYTDLQRRQDSFGQWPDTHAQSPEELAVAGFFFTGIGDCVRCHYCGLGLKHWDPDDRPLDEHVRWRSSCGYLRALCGEDVIYRTLARIGGGRNGEAAPAAAAREAVVAAVQAPPPMPGLADRDSRQSAAPRDDVADLMTSEAVVAARAMGFTTDAIERAVTALLGTRAGRRAVTAQNLVNAIIYLQARGRDPESPEASDNDTSDNDDDESGDDNGRRGGNPDDNVPPTGSHSPSNSGNAGPSPVGVVVRRSGEGAEGSVLQAASVQPRNDQRLPNQTSRQTLRELEQENQELRDRRRCKICLDNDVSILFLPCGHLVCCAECAPALRRCPMCRRRITGTVRTHLAPLPACNTS